MPAAKTQKPKPLIRFKVGASIGSLNFDVDDTAPDDVLSPATRAAWLEQGLIERVDD